MVETGGHDAVGPQPLGAQFVHFSAGGDGVAAGHHPVIGRCGDDDADPTHEARDEAHHLQARGYHGGRSARPSRTVPPAPAWTEPALGLPSAALASRWLRDARRWSRSGCELRRRQVRTAGTAALLSSAPRPLFKLGGPGQQAPIRDSPGPSRPIADRAPERGVEGSRGPGGGSRLPRGPVTRAPSALDSKLIPS